MIRNDTRASETHDPRRWLDAWRSQLLTRRRFLATVAGGALAWGLPGQAVASRRRNEVTRWSLVAAVQQHLLPTEPEAPGAREIGALSYLRTVLDHDPERADDRAFILQGAGWLDDLSRESAGVSFLTLDEAGRESVMRRIEASEAGESWLALLMVYLIEALLADPVYGGNPGGLGWQWLQHVPGFPRPSANKRYMALRQR